MTTELTILISIFIFILLGVFIGENGPKSTFEKAGPRLGARVEKQIETGVGFWSGSKESWIPPPSPDGAN